MSGLSLEERVTMIVAAVLFVAVLVLGGMVIGARIGEHRVMSHPDQWIEVCHSAKQRDCLYVDGNASWR